MSQQLQEVVLGGGCFWCTEAIFRRLKGVEKVVSGYAGGHADNPTYQQMHREETGHAEVIQIRFDQQVISFEKLLEIFWHVHDPTTKDRQGNDVGPEYRSIILYADEAQRKTAEKSKSEVATKLWDKPIVTEIKPLGKFYTAESFHQDYYNQNNNSYCQFVINPKVAKFEQKFKELLKDA